MTGPTAARIVLSDPTVDVAVLETARGGLLRAGMAMRHVDVGAVLNVQPDHLGQKGIDTLEQLAEIKRTVVEIATDTAVLNADDPHTLRMAAYTEAKHVCYVTMNPEHELVREHIRAGGRAIALEAGINGQMITIYDQGRAHPAALDAPDSGHAGRTRHVQRAERDVRGGDGVRDGRASRGHPSRAAHLRHHVLPGARPAERVRPASVQGAVRLRAQRARRRAALPAGQSHEPAGRRICVLSAPGDRRDAGHHGDRRRGRRAAIRSLHLSARRPLRGRGDDEVPRMLQEQLLARASMRRRSP